MTEINKINPKPIETVYEIKDEYKVPSFEEFMKTYEVDEKVNYDDLSGGGMGEVKGYGPVFGAFGGENYSYTGSKFSQVFLGQEPKKVYVVPPRYSSYECVYCGKSRNNETFDCCLSKSCLEKHDKDVIRR